MVKSGKSVLGPLCPKWGNLSIIGLLNQLKGDCDLKRSFRKMGSVKLNILSGLGLDTSNL